MCFCGFQRRDTWGENLGIELFEGGDDCIFYEVFWFIGSWLRDQRERPDDIGNEGFSEGGGGCGASGGMLAQCSKGLRSRSTYEWPSKTPQNNHGLSFSPLLLKIWCCAATKLSSQGLLLGHLTAYHLNNPKLALFILNYFGENERRASETTWNILESRILRDQEWLTPSHHFWQDLYANPVPSSTRHLHPR